jgi:transcriptional regulator with XRE-family HTH domain
VPKPKKSPLPPIPNSLAQVGQKIAEYRKSKGLTQIEMAEAVGISRDVLASYEIGKAHLNEEMVIRLSLFLKVPSDDLLGLKSPSQSTAPSNLRLMKRFWQIEKLPEHKKKAILKTLDDLIRANS